MSNKERRKFNKKVYQFGGHITPLKRMMHKEEDGIPVQTLPTTHRRYWSRVNNYGEGRSEALLQLSKESA